MSKFDLSSPPPPPCLCLFFLHSARKPIKLAWILRTYGTYALTKSSLLWCSCTRPSMNSDKTLSPIGKNKVERNSCEKNHYSHYYYFFLFIYYYSFKIFSHFWLAKIPSIIHHNQLLLAKFEEFCNMCTNSQGRKVEKDIFAQKVQMHRVLLRNKNVIKHKGHYSHVYFAAQM